MGIGSHWRSSTTVSGPRQRSDPDGDSGRKYWAEYRWSDCRWPSHPAADPCRWGSTARNVAWPRWPWPGREPWNWPVCPRGKKRKISNKIEWSLSDLLLGQLLFWPKNRTVLTSKTKLWAYFDLLTEILTF